MLARLIDYLHSPELEALEIDDFYYPEVEAPEIDELEVSEMEAPEIDGLSDSSIEVELSENHLRENEELSVHMSSIEAFDTNTQDVVVNVDEFINELNNLRNE